MLASPPARVNRRGMTRQGKARMIVSEEDPL